jgi:hypothetical protein
VGADDSRIENQDVQVRVAKDCGKSGKPATLGPAIKAPPLAVPVPESLGQIAPRGTGAGDPQDGIDELPIVVGDPTVLSGLARQQVLDPIPIGIRNLVATQHRRPSVAGTERRLLPELPAYCPHNLGHRWRDNLVWEKAPSTASRAPH